MTTATRSMESPDGSSLGGNMAAMGKGKHIMPWSGASRPADSDTVRRGAMWVLSAGVALIAAIVSYGHISALGRAHGGTGLAPWLLPLSVDMLILVGELMLLHEADAKGQRFILGWVLVWSGILATLFANVTYGAQFGWLGALIWGWPAYSFILAAGGMVSLVKRTTLAQEAGRVAEAAIRGAAEAELRGGFEAELAGKQTTFEAEMAVLRAELETERGTREAAETQVGELAAAAAVSQYRNQAPELDSGRRTGRRSGRETEARILQFIEQGYSPSRAGELAGVSGTRGRQVKRKWEQQAGNAPGEQDPAGKTRNTGVRVA